MALDINAIRSRLNKLQNTQRKSDNLWKPTPGKHQVRIAPYKFDKDNPFIELYFHYNINNKTYLSPASFGRPDPIVDQDNYDRTVLLENLTKNVITPSIESFQTALLDLNNAADSGFGGAITAALFLEAFVSRKVSWAHIDLMAWNTTSRPGRPEGGEAMSMRALFSLVKERFI